MQLPSEGMDPSTRSDILSPRLSEELRHTLTPGPGAPISFSTPRCRRTSDIFRPRVMRTRVYGPRRGYNKGMARKHRSLIEAALASYAGSLVYLRHAINAKVSAGKGEPWTAPSYHLIRAGEPVVFLGIWEGGLTPAGRTTGWARLLASGTVCYVPPSKLKGLCLYKEDPA